ncbi:di-heme oxidoredictase family protein [Ramlibacter sp. AN1015]|uniref:di-heme oxidoreductase family protein n=1 Tax=Ramlibacter sp. AN1015 TaxID=3133428 RepID=UPI0030BF20E7
MRPSRTQGAAAVFTAVSAAAVLGAAAGCIGVAAAEPRADDTRPGGATTVVATGKNAFSFPAANLADAERTRFVIGNSFFKRNWVEAPSSTRARDGLGPHFIARSCGACHTLDGRGAPPQLLNGVNDTQPLALLLRLSIPGDADPHLGVRPEPTYGDQFTNAAVRGVQPEGEVELRETLVHGRFADGSRYTLRKPAFGLRALAHGPLHPQVQLSARIAPQIIGMGLLEAIPEGEILANARAQADTPGPVKGTPNRVWDAAAQKTMLGRFGWKANVATVLHQTAAAFNADMGITSSLFPREACTAVQKDCLSAPRGGDGGRPEIDDKTLEDVAFYSATIAPPARRAPDDAQVRAGQALFARAQCAACHRPEYVTASGPFARLASKALQGQRIFPYTDLLLHDMGEALADGRPDFLANGRQWKTPPLWGLGLLREVNGHQRLLHDGRADGVLEAILWHGGEAEDSRRTVLEMTRAERDALVKFVESL